MFDKFTYSHLHHLAIGRIAEYWTQLALTMYGLDVYAATVDKQGIDFLVRSSNGKYFDIQVKAVRYPSTTSVFITKDGEWAGERLRDNLYLALVLIINNQPPKFYLIPANAWKDETALLKNRVYGEGKTSAPEWGINLSGKNMRLLEEYEVERQVQKMK